MTGVRADLAQFYSFKHVIEEVLGNPEFLKIKDIGGFPALKRCVLRLMQAVEVSIVATVTVADDEWFREVEAVVAHGRETLGLCKSADELFATLSATLTRLCFLQIGLVPNRRMADKTIPLKAENWKLTAHRSVQYVQSRNQKRLQADTIKRRSVARERSV